MNTEQIVLEHLNHFDVNFTVVCQEDANKYALIDEISRWLVDYCKKNNVAIVNNVTGKKITFPIFASKLTCIWQKQMMELVL